MGRDQPTTPPARQAEVDEVWAAEDGRCERCRRPMDRRAAVVLYAVGSPPRLACRLCEHGLFEPFSRGLQPKRSLGVTLSAANALRDALDAYGVVITFNPRGNAAMMWLPGVGRFLVCFERDGPAQLRKAWLRRPAALRVQPQARTRGLPPLVLRARPPKEAAVR